MKFLVSRGRWYRRLETAFYCLFALILSGAAALANQHTLSCLALQQGQTFHLCKDGNECTVDPQDSFTIEQVNANTVIGISVTFESVTGARSTGNPPAEFHIMGQGKTTLDVVMHFDQFPAPAQTASYTISTEKTFDAQFQIDNPPKPGNTPQLFSYTVTCSPGPTTGSITIQKSVSGADATFNYTTTGTGLSAFSLTTVNGNAPPQTFTNLAPGSYSVTETPLAGYTLTGLSCSGTGGSSGSASAAAPSTANITVTAGGTVTCTYTNTQSVSGGKIVINKATSGGPLDEQFSYSTTGTGLSSFTLTPGGQKVFLGLAAGTYSITETLPSTSWNVSLVCSAAGASTVTPTVATATPTATITLAANDTVTCNYTNSLVLHAGTGLVHIEKRALGSNGQFDFTTSGGTFTNFSLTTSGSATGGSASQDFTLASGVSYTVQESGMPTGWNFTSLSCSSTGTGTTVTTSGTLATMNLQSGGVISCTYINTVSTAPTPSSITIVKQTNSARDGSFGFASTIPGASGFTLTTVEGFASVKFANVANGTYTVTEANLGTGWSLASLSCTGSQTVNTTTRTATITITGSVGVTCTFTNVFNEQFIRDRTSETIRNFMNRRADLITSEEPDRNRMIRRLTGSLWGAGGGGDGTPFAFAGSSSAQGGNVNFSTSVSQVIRAANAADRGKSGNGRGRPLDSEWNPDVDVWLEAHYNYFTENRFGFDRSGNFGLVYMGADYLYTPNLLVGALIQLDTMTDNWKSTGIATSGNGWMAGPYATARISENIFLDGRIAWGQSFNNVSPFGTYTDKFYTERWLARMNATGNWNFGSWRITPSAGVTYFSEQQAGYTDSLDVFIPSQTIKLGRATFGPEIGYRFQTSSGSIIEPHFAITGIWDFLKDRTMTIQGFNVGVADVRARVEGGILYKDRNDFALRWTVSYDGIGDNSLHVIGTQIWLNAPLTVESLTNARARGFSYNWTGGYVGAQVGVSNAHFLNQLAFNGADAPGTQGASTVSQIAGMGGAFAGYNQRSGPFVVGAEADISFRDPRKTAEKNLYTISTDTDDGFFVKNSLGTNGSVRGRFGYAWDKGLLYGTAGLALGQIVTEIRPDGGPDQDMPATTYRQSGLRLGWTAGLGLDYGFDEHWFGRAEARYTRFGTAFNLTDPALLPDAGPNTNRTAISNMEGRLGVGYRF